MLSTTVASPQRSGYTDNDSAGQTNIFAVEVWCSAYKPVGAHPSTSQPKTYVQGSALDTTDGQSNLIAAFGAGFVGFAAIAAGLVILGQKGSSGAREAVFFCRCRCETTYRMWAIIIYPPLSDDVYVPGQYKALSEYKAAFVAELKPAAATVSAPALTE